MCYIIAKIALQPGCIALRTAHGKGLIALKRRIEAQIGYETIELITISRPSAYSEYGPFHFVKTEDEFENAVIQMWQTAAPDS